MTTKFKKANIVKNYLVRFPNTPSLSLARKVYSENNEHFKDVEDVRGVIRYSRGLNGKNSRKNTNKEFRVRPNSLNPYNLPKSDAKKQSVFHLPKKCNNILFLSDLHIPFHNINALTVALKYGKEKKINCIFINGDLIDFYQISRFVTLERKRSVAEELMLANQFLDSLNKFFPKIPIYFLFGNHDMRLQKYLAVKAPELLDVPEFRLEMLLKAKEHNMTVIPDTTLVKVEKLNITHGHLVLRGFFSPVNGARGTFLRAKASTIISHIHNVSTHTEKTIAQRFITCYSTGCLCEITPAYNPFSNNFNHGFAHITTEKGMFRVRNMQILEGQIVN